AFSGPCSLMKATAFLTIATASSLVAPPAEAPPTKTNVAASAEMNGFVDRMFMSFSGSIDGQNDRLSQKCHERENHSLSCPSERQNAFDRGSTVRDPLRSHRP